MMYNQGVNAGETVENFFPCCFAIPIVGDEDRIMDYLGYGVRMGPRSFHGVRRVRDICTVHPYNVGWSYWEWHSPDWPSWTSI
jgi:hypothetical protein